MMPNPTTVDEIRKALMMQEKNTKKLKPESVFKGTPFKVTKDGLRHKITKDDLVFWKNLSDKT